MKTVKISEETHKLLLSLGRKGETFDQIIKRVVEFYIKAEKEM